jgi:hypothetical protein
VAEERRAVRDRNRIRRQKGDACGHQRIRIATSGRRPRSAPRDLGSKEPSREASEAALDCAYSL